MATNSYASAKKRQLQSANPAPQPTTVGGFRVAEQQAAQPVAPQPVKNYSNAAARAEMINSYTPPAPKVNTNQGSAAVTGSNMNPAQFNWTAKSQATSPDPNIQKMQEVKPPNTFSYQNMNSPDASPKISKSALETLKAKQAAAVLPATNESLRNMQAAHATGLQPGRLTDTTPETPLSADLQQYARGASGKVLAEIDRKQHEAELTKAARIDAMRKQAQAYGDKAPWQNEELKNSLADAAVLSGELNKVYKSLEPANDIPLIDYSMEHGYAPEYSKAELIKRREQGIAALTSPDNSPEIIGAKQQQLGGLSNKIEQGVRQAQSPLVRGVYGQDNTEQKIQNLKTLNETNARLAQYSFDPEVKNKAIADHAATEYQIQDLEQSVLFKNIGADKADNTPDPNAKKIDRPHSRGSAIAQMNYSSGMLHKNDASVDNAAIKMLGGIDPKIAEAPSFVFFPNNFKGDRDKYLSNTSKSLGVVKDYDPNKQNEYLHYNYTGSSATSLDFVTDKMNEEQQGRFNTAFNKYLEQTYPGYLESGHPIIFDAGDITNIRAIQTAILQSNSDDRAKFWGRGTTEGALSVYHTEISNAAWNNKISDPEYMKFLNKVATAPQIVKDTTGVDFYKKENIVQQGLNDTRAGMIPMMQDNPGAFILQNVLGAAPGVGRIAGATITMPVMYKWMGSAAYEQARMDGLSHEQASKIATESGLASALIFSGQEYVKLSAMGTGKLISALAKSGEKAATTSVMETSKSALSRIANSQLGRNALARGIAYSGVTAGVGDTQIALSNAFTNYSIELAKTGDYTQAYNAFKTGYVEGAKNGLAMSLVMAAVPGAIGGFRTHVENTRISYAKNAIKGQELYENQIAPALRGETGAEPISFVGVIESLAMGDGKLFRDENKYTVTEEQAAAYKAQTGRDMKEVSYLELYKEQVANLKEDVKPDRDPQILNDTLSTLELLDSAVALGHFTPDEARELDRLHQQAAEIRKANGIKESALNSMSPTMSITKKFESLGRAFYDSKPWDETGKEPPAIGDKYENIYGKAQEAKGRVADEAVRIQNEQKQQVQTARDNFKNSEPVKKMANISPEQAKGIPYEQGASAGIENGKLSAVVTDKGVFVRLETDKGNVSDVAYPPGTPEERVMELMGDTHPELAKVIHEAYGNRVEVVSSKEFISSLPDKGEVKPPSKYETDNLKKSIRDALGSLKESKDQRNVVTKITEFAQKYKGDPKGFVLNIEELADSIIAPIMKMDTKIGGETKTIWGETIGKMKGQTIRVSDAIDAELKHNGESVPYGAFSLGGIFFSRTEGRPWDDIYQEFHPEAHVEAGAWDAQTSFMEFLGELRGKKLTDETHVPYEAQAGGDIESLRAMIDSNVTPVIELVRDYISKNVNMDKARFDSEVNRLAQNETERYINGRTDKARNTQKQSADGRAEEAATGRGEPEGLGTEADQQRIDDLAAEYKAAPNDNIDEAIPPVVAEANQKDAERIAQAHETGRFFANVLGNFHARATKGMRADDPFVQKMANVIDIEIRRADEKWSGEEEVHKQAKRRKKKSKSEQDAQDAQEKQEILYLKDQIAANKEKIAEHGIIATGKTRGLKANDNKSFLEIVKFFNSKGFVIDRQGFDKIVVDRERIRKAWKKYVHHDNQAEAFPFAYDVIKRGIEIERHPNHKNYGIETVTFAGRVVINGEPGDMAVVVHRFKGKRYFRVHEIVAPDGSVLFLEHEEAPTAQGSGGKAGKTNYIVDIHSPSVLDNETIRQGREDVKRPEIHKQSVFHGSPYQIAKFSMNHVGTGEGAQAHGHGLYFAKSRMVAEGYKDRLSEKNNDMLDPDVMLRDAYELVYRDDTYTDRYSAITDEAVEKYRNEIAKEEDISPDEVPLWDIAKRVDENIISLPINNDGFISNLGGLGEASDIIETAALFDAFADVEEQARREAQGNVYAADIPPDEVMLNEQLPFSEQPEAVKGALNRIMREAVNVDEAKIKNDIADIEQKERVAGVIYRAHSNGVEAKRVDLATRASELLGRKFDENDYLLGGEFPNGINEDEKRILNSDQDYQRISKEHSDALEERHRAYTELNDLIGERQNLESQLRSQLRMLEGAIERDATGRDIYLALGKDLFNQEQGREGNWMKPITGDEQASRKLNEFGVKGIKYDGKKDGECYVVFDDNSIEILDRLYQELDKGEIVFNKDDMGMIVNLFESSDASTGIHEVLGHAFLKYIQTAVMFDECPKEIRDSWEAIKKELGIKDGEEITDEQHEQFARMAERYIHEGKFTGSPEMKSVLKQFMEWIRSVYKSANDLGVKISPEMRQVFDHLFADAEMPDGQKIARAKLEEMKAPKEPHPSIAKAQESVKKQLAEKNKDEGKQEPKRDLQKIYDHMFAQDKLEADRRLQMEKSYAEGGGAWEVWGEGVIPLPKKQNARVISLEDIIKKLGNGFGIELHTGQLEENNARAEFRPRVHVVDTAKFGHSDIVGYAHEIGHWLDEKFGIVRKYAEKLKEIGEKMPYIKKTDGYEKEVFGELVRFMVLNPEFARELAKLSDGTNFIDTINRLYGFGMYMKQIKGASEDFRRWYHADWIERDMSQNHSAAQSNPTKHSYSTLADISNLYKKAGYRYMGLRAYWVDRYAVMYKIAMDINKARKKYNKGLKKGDPRQYQLSPLDNMSILSEMTYTPSERTANLISGPVMFTPNGEVVMKDGKPVKGLLATLHQKREGGEKALLEPDEYKLFGVYVNALTAYERKKIGRNTFAKDPTVQELDVDSELQELAGKIAYFVGSKRTFELTGEVVKNVEGKHPHFHEAQQALNGWKNTFVEEWMVNTGELSIEDWNTMQSIYPNHWPIRRVLDKDTRGVMKKTSSGGSDLDMYEPMEALLMYASDIVSHVTHQNMMKALDRVYRGGDIGREIISDYLIAVDAKEAERKLKAKETLNGKYNEIAKENLNEEGLEQYNAAENKAAWLIGHGYTEAFDIMRDDLFQQSMEQDGKIITVYDENHEAHYYEKASGLGGAYMGRALSALSEEEALRALNVVAAIKNITTVTTTAYNPVFAFSNFLRDIPTSLFQSQIPFWEMPFEMGKAAFDIVTSKRNPTGNRAQTNIMGGGHDTITSDFRQERSNYDKITRTMGPRYAYAMAKNDKGHFAAGMTRYIGKSMIMGVSAMNEFIEALPRQAQANRQLRGGSIFATEAMRQKSQSKKYGHNLSDAEKRMLAVHEYHDSSVFFAKSGYGVAARIFYKFVPFGRASLQGIDKFVRAGVIEDNKGVRYTNALATITLLSLGIRWMMSHSSDDDWKELSKFYMDGYITFNGKDIPIISSMMPDAIVKIPIAREVGTVFSTVPLLIMEGYETGDWSGLFLRGFDVAKTNFLPATQIALGSILNAVKNVNWMGNEIVNTQKYRTQLDAAKAAIDTGDIATAHKAYMDIQDEKTTPFATTLAAAINIADFGGVLAKYGGVVNTPMGVQYVLDQTFGIVTQIANKAQKSDSAKSLGENLLEIVYDKVFVDPYKSNQSVTAFYNSKGLMTYEYGKVADRNGDKADKEWNPDDLEFKHASQIYNAVSGTGITENAKPKVKEGEVDKYPHIIPVPSMSDISTAIKNEKDKGKAVLLEQDKAALAKIAMLEAEGGKVRLPDLSKEAWFNTRTPEQLKKYQSWADSIYETKVTLQNDKVAGSIADDTKQAQKEADAVDITKAGYVSQYQDTLDTITAKVNNSKKTYGDNWMTADPDSHQLSVAKKRVYDKTPKDGKGFKTESGYFKTHNDYVNDAKNATNPADVRKANLCAEAINKAIANALDGIAPTRSQYGSDDEWNAVKDFWYVWNQPVK